MLRRIVALVFTMLALITLLSVLNLPAHLQMLETVGVRQQPAGLFKQQVVHAKTVPQIQNQISKAFVAFEDLLTISKVAATPGSHWRVRLTSWRNTQQAWEEVSGTLPTPVLGLEHCALPLGTARKLLEQADDLFVRAEGTRNPARAVELVQEHETLQKQARGLLKQAEDGYRAILKAYLKSGGVLLPTSGLMNGQEPSPTFLKSGVQERLGSRDESCRGLWVAIEMDRQASNSPERVESDEWKDAGDRLNDLFRQGLLMNCHCPILTARMRIERLRQLQIMRLHPPARDARSIKNLDYAIQQEKEGIQAEIKRMEGCYKTMCGERPVPGLVEEKPKYDLSAPMPVGIETTGRGSVPKRRSGVRQKAKTAPISGPTVLRERANQNTSKTRVKQSARRPCIDWSPWQLQLHDLIVKQSLALRGNSSEIYLRGRQRYLLNFRVGADRHITILSQHPSNEFQSYCQRVIKSLDGKPELAFPSGSRRQYVDESYDIIPRFKKFNPNGWEAVTEFNVPEAVKTDQECP